MKPFLTAIDVATIVAPVMLAYATIWWITALIKRNNSIVDISWGPGIFLASAVGYWVLQPTGDAPLVLLGCIGLWALRLASMIALKQHGHGEDKRYAAWRGAWGDQAWWRSFFKVFLLQAALMIVIALTPIAAFAGTMESGWLTVIGVVIFLFGLVFETVGDFQLYRFKRNPAHRGQLMTTGLWRYTRHPNYFGEAALWIGIGLIALPAAGWPALIAPVIVIYLVRFLSGVPIAERHYAGRKDFDMYASRTNTFIPWIPKQPDVD